MFVYLWKRWAEMGEWFSGQLLGYFAKGSHMFTLKTERKLKNLLRKAQTKSHALNRCCRIS